jgi:hypothetical protein
MAVLNPDPRAASRSGFSAFATAAVANPEARPARTVQPRISLPGGRDHELVKPG